MSNKKRISILGAGGNLKFTCISVFTAAGYDVVLDDWTADGLVVFDIFPNTIQEKMVALNISAPVFWLKIFPVEDREPIKALKDITFEVIHFGMVFEEYFSKLADRMKEKVPLQ